MTRNRFGKRKIHDKINVPQEAVLSLFYRMLHFSSFSLDVEVVFFDAAGTLIEPAEPVGTTYARFFQKHGIDADPSNVESSFRRLFPTLGPPRYHQFPATAGDAAEVAWWKSLVKNVLAEVSPGNDVHETVFPELYHYYELPETWKVFPDVPRALQQFSDQCRLAVLSNFDSRLHSILEGLGLASHFEHRFVSGEIQARKPDRRIFEYAAKTMSVSPASCLHIGDDPVCDWWGGKEAGMQVFELSRKDGKTLDCWFDHSRMKDFT